MTRHSYLRNVDTKFVINFENTSLVSEVAKLKKENSPLILFVLLTAKVEILLMYYYMVHYNTIENNTRYWQDHTKSVLYCTVLKNPVKESGAVFTTVYFLCNQQTYKILVLILNGTIQYNRKQYLILGRRY